VSTRRAVLAGGGIGLLTFAVAGVASELTPQQAKIRSADLQTLTAGEAALLEAFGEVLAPGARAAGIAHFVDQQLGVPPNDCLLMVKYFNVPPPYPAFYRSGLAALERFSRQRTDRDFATLDSAAAEALVRELVAGQPNGWTGPSPFLFYLSVRADAVDTVYGTMDGFARLGIPYMPHIVPTAPW
jgi:hypothetical protein